jgi:hypothetical protein
MGAGQSRPRRSGAGFGDHRPPMERAMAGMGEHGRWWNDPKVAERLKLTDTQRKAMDDTLQQHRETLIDLRGTLEKSELELEPMMKEDQPNESAILAQIDKTLPRRARNWRKANARFPAGDSQQAERRSNGSRCRPIAPAVRMGIGTGNMMVAPRTGMDGRGPDRHGMASGRRPGSSSASAGRTAEHVGRRGWPRCAPSSPASGRVAVAIRQPVSKTRFTGREQIRLNAIPVAARGDPLAADFFVANACHRQGLRSATVPNPNTGVAESGQGLPRNQTANAQHCDTTVALPNSLSTVETTTHISALHKND